MPDPHLPGDGPGQTQNPPQGPSPKPDRLAVRAFLGMVCRVLWPLSAAILRPFFQKRLAFERKNRPAPLPTFPDKRAHIAFEVSSEGELEQIRFLLEDILREGKIVELIYCSESVEKNVDHLLQTFPKALRVFRLPLLTSSPLTDPKSSALHFLTAPILVLCRYDFFPELLLYGLTKARLFVLLSGALSPRARGMGALFYRPLFRLFDLIVPVSPQEGERFKALLGSPVSRALDLRALRIRSRLQKAHTTFRAKGMERYLDFIESWPGENRLLLGQFYAHEFDIIKDPALWQALSEGKILLCLCLHSSSQKERDETVRKALAFSDSFPSLPPLQIIGEKELQGGEFSPFHLLDLRGVLCELYSLFPVSYIGGGFGKSIHSVLEPFLADSHVICGPKVHRSSEYEFIHTQYPKALTTLSRKEDFLGAFRKALDKKHTFLGLGPRFMTIMEERYEKLRRELLYDPSR
ncbi:MAG: hypothetical protein OXB88_02890 [Bacteriovoracales bacterium]|nr:hypothetical protein [Bacteriovoracales bacterium]